jgi:hypothetical protein
MQSLIPNPDDSGPSLPESDQAILRSGGSAFWPQMTPELPRPAPDPDWPIRDPDPQPPKPDPDGPSPLD